MSDEIGFVSVLPQDGDGWGMYGSSQVSERTRQRVEAEVERFVEEARDEAIRLFTENRGRLDGIAEALLREERLDQSQPTPPPGSLRPRAGPAAPVAT